MTNELSAPRPHGVAANRLWRHLVRAAGRDTRPLVRPADRAHSRLMVQRALAVLMALMLAVAATWATWVGEHRRVLDDERRQVRATTVTEAVASASDTRSGVPDAALAEATWSRPGSGAHSGVVEVPPGTAAGSVVRIWVDEHGRLVPKPPTDADMAMASALAGVSVFTVLAGAAAAVTGFRDRRLDARTLEAWEAEWAAVEPRWSGRRDE
ncbi:Rv1733c family protein [Streptomyces wuyuanensis]|uniref:Rv1733c family protein n=1 Tax=Streptomyces wuyuanensis TaxID=1196353 RepID=UPI003D7084E0